MKQLFNDLLSAGFNHSIEGYLVIILNVAMSVNNIVSLSNMLAINWAGTL